jgi:hypothetical protein
VSAGEDKADAALAQAIRFGRAAFNPEADAAAMLAYVAGAISQQYPLTAVELALAAGCTFDEKQLREIFSGKAKP